jgi:hypothetical protein
MRKLLEDFVHQANEEMTFGYRLDVDGEFFTLVPTTTRSPLGEIVSAMPMLDRKVTIPHGARPIAESANVMANALSAQTGLRVSCCAADVMGIRLGMTVAPFEAHDEPARKVLERLIRMSGSQKYWLFRCDHDWCAINLFSVGNAAQLDSHEQAAPLRSGFLAPP